MKSYIAVFLVLILCTGNAYSASLRNVTGKIHKVQILGINYQAYSTSGEAIVFIHMNSLPISCGNSNGFRRVAITSNHPAYNAVLSAALSAKASEKSVMIHYLEECTLWNANAWDFSMITVL